MKYKVHKLNINIEKESDKLEDFLNNLRGEVIAIIPDIKTVLFCYGAKIRTILIIEKIRR